VKKVLRRLAKAVPLLFWFSGICGISSCSRTEPSIEFGFVELAYYQGVRGPEERFSFFIIPGNEDGLEDLSELYLYHDREGLRWKLESGDWVSYEEEERTWIGSRAIAMSGGGSLPRGLFRAVLLNKGGEKSERTFTFDAPVDSPYPFPFFTVSEGSYRIDSKYPKNSLLCYDAQGNTVSVLNLTSLEGPVSALNISGNVRTVSLWAEDPEYRTSAVTDAVPLR
jgi:hypothetical protein